MSIATREYAYFWQSGHLSGNNCTQPRSHRSGLDFPAGEQHRGYSSQIGNEEERHLPGEYSSQIFIYLKCKQNTMSTNSVYSIRIDSNVRKMIDELNDPSWQDEIRTLIEQTARKKRKAQLLARAREAQRTMEEGSPAAESIREDRDER